MANFMLTVVIITKNEEEMIADCIRSAAFADDVLVVDSDSTDSTREIAKKMGVRVINHTFINYANQRNVGLNSAKGEWILYIDADERVSKNLQKEILDVTRETHDNVRFSAYKILRENYYLGKNKWPGSEYLERLFYKKSFKTWKGKVHEHAEFHGETGVLHSPIIHYTHRDLESMTNKTNTWADVEAEMIERANHPRMSPWRFIRIMLTRFIESYIKQGGWKAGTVGLIESMYQAYSYFIIYTKLWERQKNKKLSN